MICSPVEWLRCTNRWQQLWWCLSEWRWWGASKKVGERSRCIPSSRQVFSFRNGWCYFCFPPFVSKLYQRCGGPPLSPLWKYLPFQHLEKRVAQLTLQRKQEWQTQVRGAGSWVFQSCWRSFQGKYQTRWLLERLSWCGESISHSSQSEWCERCVLFSCWIEDPDIWNSQQINFKIEVSIPKFKK